MLKIFRYVSLLLTLSTFLLADGKIVGRVFDAVTGKGLPMANVIIKGTKIGTSCDTDGFFVLTKVPPGDHILVASMVGYKPKEASVSIKGNEVREVHFYLSEEVLGLRKLLLLVKGLHWKGKYQLQKVLCRERSWILFRVRM
ncbi:MAG: carboxypeptidase-like regulatory domain-containing protein [Candidatus Hydrothermia bacterium]